MIDNSTSKEAKPFLKWVGGKTQLLNVIRKYYPFADKSIKKYAEPFLGGGAVLFDILNNYELEEVLVSDINLELVNTYLVVKNNVEELITELYELENEYIPLSKEERTNYYSEIREKFNSIHLVDDKTLNIEKAALMIFLNKTCFNGLFRVNLKGEFNVPVGDYKNPKICDEENLRAVSEKLQKVTIKQGKFTDILDFVDENTFVYFDPPYRPLTKTSSFTSYSKSSFNDDTQAELAEFAEILRKKNAKVLLSNSDPKNSDPEDNFFEELYSTFIINRVSASRMINSKGTGRGKINELLISNYSSDEYNKEDMEENDMTRNFEEWLATFRKSIANYSYYANFEKIYNNVDEIKIELNILNSLIGSKNIAEDFENLVAKYPEVLKCIPILLAVRANEIYAMDEDGEFTYNFKKPNLTPEQYKVFMEKTGLFELISKHLINNLVDYVTGVETGLDSNGRKNRGGHLMEDLVESFIRKAGFKRDETYFKEMYIHEITEKWGLDLSAISNQGKTEKRFDFVIKTENMVYGIETNFYASGGSKLNETARSYKTLSLESDTIDGFTFVWFTDGKGWVSARNNLKETCDIMENVYNIKDLEEGILKKF